MRVILVTFIFSLFYLLQADNISSLLFNGNCITCHKEAKTVSAPSVVEFKKRYKSAFPNKDDFVKYMSEWVQNPNKTTSLMHDSIKKHGLMPNLCYDIETLRDITSYIYDTDFTSRGGRYWKKEKND